MSAGGPSIPDHIDTLPSDYDAMEELLDELLDECMSKVRSGRVYDATNERVRIKWIRMSKEIITEQRKLGEQRDVEELYALVEALGLTEDEV